MSGRTTAVLFLILLLLAGFLYWQNQAQIVEEARPEATPTPGTISFLPGIEMADLRRLEIIRTTTGESLHYLYEAGADSPWQVVESEERFQGGMLDVHMSAFLGIRRTHTFAVTPETNLADFGLDPPEYEITIDLYDAENDRVASHTFLIGRRTTTDLAYYAQQPEVPEQIYIIPSGFISNMIDILDMPPIRPLPEETE
jgi:hypothetical protein